MSLYKQNDGVGGNAGSVPGKTHFFLSRRFDADVDHIRFHRLGQACTHGIYIGRQLWLLGNDGDIRVSKGITVIGKQGHHLSEHFHTVCPQPPVILIRKELSDIAQCSGTQKCIHQSVYGDVGVRVAIGAEFRWHLHSAENAGPAGFDYAYRYPGMNKVLQAAGRVIRTQTDRGVIVLLDSRFAEAANRRLFPREWSDAVYVTAGTVGDELAHFWK